MNEQYAQPYGFQATANDSSVTCASRSHLSGADGIRGFACLIVMMAHAAVLFFPSTYPYLRGVGKIGVWLFFSLSSYLLTHQLLRRGMSILALADYAISRCLRIYPLFALVILFQHAYGRRGVKNIEDVVNVLLFEKGYSIFWTIPVEFRFYFLLPPMVWAGQRLYKKFGCSGVLLAGLLFTVVHQRLFPYWELQGNDINTFEYLPAFLFGSIGALLKFNERFSWLDKSATVIGVGVVLAILAATPFMRYALFGAPPSTYLINKYLFISLGWSVFIFAQINQPGILQKVFSSRWLMGVGVWSYSIYLIHYIIVEAFAKAFPGRLDMAALSIAASIGVGYVMYLLFEQPLMSTRKRLAVLLRLPAYPVRLNNTL